jgi:hypothetical protein
MVAPPLPVFFCEKEREREREKGQHVREHEEGILEQRDDKISIREPLLKLFFITKEKKGSVDINVRT